MFTESFNTMTAQLAEASERAEETHHAIETTRAYLESVLGQSVGGRARVRQRFRFRTANPSAAVILQQPLAELFGVPLADWGEAASTDAFASSSRKAFARAATAVAEGSGARWLES